MKTRNSILSRLAVKAVVGFTVFVLVLALLPNSAQAWAPRPLNQVDIRHMDDKDEGGWNNPTATGTRPSARQTISGGSIYLSFFWNMIERVVPHERNVTRLETGNDGTQDLTGVSGSTDTSGR